MLMLMHINTTVKMQKEQLVEFYVHICTYLTDNQHTNLVTKVAPHPTTLRHKETEKLYTYLTQIITFAYVETCIQFRHSHLR